MILAQFLVVLFFIFLGMRVGGIGVGFAGGAGVIVLSFLGAVPGELPMLVIVFIMVVIIAISAMQEAGGIDYLVNLTEKIIRRHPRLLVITSPLATYILTLMASTGQVSFACMPVIIEVAKENNIRPTRALSIAVAGSLLGIVASPISAAVIFLSNLLEKSQGAWGYIELIAVSIPSTFLGVICTSIFYMMWDGVRKNDILSDNPEYNRRIASNLIKPKIKKELLLKPGAKRSVLIFLTGLVIVLAYAILSSPKLALLSKPVMSGGEARISIMMAVALSIVIFCKANVHAISSSSVFKTGMTSCVCILGVAWLGTTFMDNNREWLQLVASEYLLSYPWIFAIVLIFASSFLYSQAASTKIFFPTALSIGLAPSVLVSCFPATAALFILPNYPTLLAAVELDDTGSTQLGKKIIDHPFLIPGLMATGLSVIFSFGLSYFIG